jgi:hypothetical protein
MTVCASLSDPLSQCAGILQVPAPWREAAYPALMVFECTEPPMIDNSIVGCKSPPASQIWIIWPSKRVHNSWSLASFCHFTKVCQTLLSFREGWVLALSVATTKRPRLGLKCTVPRQPISHNEVRFLRY